MNFLIWLLRILSIPIAIIGAFTCVILIGIAILMLAKDMNEWADKLEMKYLC